MKKQNITVIVPYIRSDFYDGLWRFSVVWGDHQQDLAFDMATAESAGHLVGEKLSESLKELLAKNPPKLT
jgi:hypothetical protein